jgi:hypothetical protein
MSDHNDGEGQEYVYAIGHPHGFVKIGRSKDPTQRLKDHQVSCPYDLWIVAQVPTDDSRAVENQLHERWSEKCVRGEWFELEYADYDRIIDLVKMADSEHEFESVEEFRRFQRKQNLALSG